MKHLSRWVAPVLTLAGVLAVSALALRLGGFDVSRAFAAFVSGALGDRQRLALTLTRSVPLALTGLAVAIALRAGQWNIGAEGQLLAGAVAAVWAGTRSGLAGSPATLLLAGAAGGALFGLVPGWLKAWRGVPEVLVTILLNFVALETLSYAVQGPLAETRGQYPQTDVIATASELPRLGVFPLGLALAILAAVGLHLWLAFFRSGFAVRVAGSNPAAARAAGIRVRAMTVAVFVLSGALAGLGGAAEVQGSIHRLYEGYSPGYGFTAIAVALLARSRPLWVIPSALAFAALSAGADRMEALQGVPAVLSSMVQAMVVVGCAVAQRHGAEEARP